MLLVGVTLLVYCLRVYYYTGGRARVEQLLMI